MAHKNIVAPFIEKQEFFARGSNFNTERKVMKGFFSKKVLCCLILVVFSAIVFAQTPEFVYQGQIQDGGVPANGNHDFEFYLFDQLAGGTQIGTMVPRNAVAVANGVFTVNLDFGATSFPGANRFLEMRVRVSGGGAFTTMVPRMQILSTPYSTRALNATTADSLTTTGSGNYIQNTTTQQASSNFNVSGSGTVGSLTTSGAATFGGIGAPANAPAGQGRLYFDTASSKFRVSQNGGAFVDLVGSGGLTGSGAANTIPMFSTATSIGNSAMSQLNGHIGIGLANPTAKLDLLGTGWGSVLRINESTSGNSLVLQAGSGNTMKVTGYNYNTSTAVPLFLSIDGANTILNSGGGFVGIGTSNPSSALTVQTSGGTYGLTHTNGTVTLATGTVAVGTILDGGWLGTRSNHSLHFFTNDGFPTATLATNGNFGIGTNNPTSKLHVAGTIKTNSLQVTAGSDLAENFEMKDAATKSGMVVAIDPEHEGKLVLARGAYNRRVVGIVSGANNLSAGMVLPDLEESDKAMPVALSGRVWVYVDAGKGSVRPGDLLTTSNTPGYAMKVTNHRRANGAIIGKAMTKLTSGKGLVLVLVSLQ